MSAPAAPGGGRIALIDALRGFALMGIVQVNVQCFTWGGGDVLGYLAQPPRAAESLLYFLQAAFLEGKFYPIFAFLFGAGLSLQLRRLRRAGPARAPGATACSLVRRRLAFLLLAGIAHGVLLFYGDVLLAYALCGLLLLWLAGRRPGALARLARRCGALALASLLLPVLLAAAFDARSTSTPGDPAIAAAHAAYLHLGWRAQLGQRCADALWQQTASVVFFWPQVLFLMALGAIAGRRGWLEHPEHHARVWAWARRWGWGAGLPCALAGAALATARARGADWADSAWVDVLLGAGSLLAAGYVGSFVARWQAGAPRAVRALGWAGRMSLTNYLAQSLVMGFALTGWGLALEPDRAGLAAFALGLFLLQAACSRAWLRHHAQGPAEALWRRWTYGARAGASSSPAAPAS